MINTTALFISLLIGLGILFFIIFFASIFYRAKDKEDWLLHNLNDKMYSAFYGDKDKEETAVKKGLNLEKYYKNCDIAGEPYKLSKMIMDINYGIACLVLFVLTGIITGRVLLFIPGCLLFLYITFSEQIRLDNIVKKKKAQIQDELPRFLDLLQSELQVGITTEMAICMLCSRFNGLLSREMMDSLNEVKLGLHGWTKALENVAEKYEVEILSDFVLDITTAHEKGVSVAASVARMAKDIHTTYLLNAKERAGRSTNTILIPIAVFQMLPMLAVLIIPILSEVQLLY